MQSKRPIASIPFDMPDIRRIVGIACLTAATSCGSPRPATDTLPLNVNAAVRGVWIPSPDHTDFFSSQQTIEKQLDELAAAGINTVFVVMWNQGRTLYPSRVMKALTGHEIDARLDGRDPLLEIINAARPHGIRVFAWFEFGFASDVRDGNGREIAEKKPRWVALAMDGKPVIKNGFRWLNGLDPDVQAFMLSLVMEVVENYDIAGIQGDDRLPALPVEGGYNPGTADLYRQDHGGRDPPINARDPEWVQWRSDRLSKFLARLYREAKQVNPNIVVSMAPGVFPWSRDEYLQDWPAWVRNGWVDQLSPQLYRRDFRSYQVALHTVTRELLNPAQVRIVFPGILLNLGNTYQATDDYITQVLAANRREGITGEVFFYHEGVRTNTRLFRQLYAPQASIPVWPNEQKYKEPR
jgi:uncharacterized lipoprotein YddW (UPF0748 family)